MPLSFVVASFCSIEVLQIVWINPVCKTIENRICVTTIETPFFIRVSPLMSDLPENRDIFSSLCFRKAPLYIHPESAWILEIDRDEEDLLSEMRKTTRYSIRKAQNDGVKTHISGKSEDIERFWKLYEITAKRQDFVSYSKKFIETEFKSFGDNIFWVLNEYAAAVIVLNENEGFYHHGASTHHPTASYAVQWEAIKELRRRGRKWYNFWGVWNDPKSPQAGLSNFKRGFGGFEESYVKTQDLPLSAKYWINYIVESARKKQRGF